MRCFLLLAECCFVIQVSVFALTLDMQDVESVKKVQESLPPDFAEVRIRVL